MDFHINEVHRVQLDEDYKQTEVMNNIVSINFTENELKILDILHYYAEDIEIDRHNDLRFLNGGRPHVHLEAMGDMFDFGFLKIELVTSMFNEEPIRMVKLTDLGELLIKRINNPDIKTTGKANRCERHRPVET